jgi:hypothetical protein
MRLNNYTKIYIGGFLSLLLVLSSSASSFADGNFTAIPDPTPEAGSYGLEATKTQPAPTTGATISIPSNGASYTTSPITVGGICPNGLLVEIYDNDVLVGAEDCTGGSFSLKVSLFNGQNVLTAEVYDDLNQSGPVSNIVTVTYSSPSFASFPEQITLTSSYGRIGVSPGQTLTWPLQISGGVGPYALSINWGDGSPNQLKSLSASGDFDITHVYSNSGIYEITVEATDHNGVSAFIQLVAIADGNIASSSTTTTTKNASSKSSGGTTTEILWLPTIVCLLLILPSFILGRRSQAAAANIRRKSKTKKVKDKKKDKDKAPEPVAAEPTTDKPNEPPQPEELDKK